MRVHIYSFFHFELTSFIVHLLDKPIVSSLSFLNQTIVRVVTHAFIWIFCLNTFHTSQFISSPSCKGNTSIITTRQYQPIKQLLHRINFTSWYLSRSPIDTLFIFCNFYLLGIFIDTCNFTYLEDKYGCHYFSQRSYLLLAFWAWFEHYSSW